MAFEITSKDAGSRARTGILRTAHGEVETPVFMPVATQGSVKALSSEDLAALGVQAILSNSYHLYLRPGAELVAQAGGLHRFMGFPGSILTDSGGFQVLSLADLRSITDESVTFKSHLDGSMHTLTPESVIRLQARLGSDIWTTLDECPPFPCTEAEAERALGRTMRWMEASAPVFKEESAKREAPALFFPVVQGSLYPVLRARAAEHAAGLGVDGFSLGGYCVGEEKERTWSVLEGMVEHLPGPKPRYLMGMGTPVDLWEAVRLGVDMLDCVWPTRVARNGHAITADGGINIQNRAFQNDFSPLDTDCGCMACRRHTRAYISHLHRAKELSAYRLLTLHNVHYSLQIMRRIRAAIRAGTFMEERRRFLEAFASKSAIISA